MPSRIIGMVICRGASAAAWFKLPGRCTLLHRTAAERCVPRPTTMTHTLTRAVRPLRQISCCCPCSVDRQRAWSCAGAGCSSSQVGHRSPHLTDPSPSAGPRRCCCRSSAPPARSAETLGSRQTSRTRTSGRQSAGSRRHVRPRSRRATPQRRIAAASARLLTPAAGDWAAHRAAQPRAATGPAAPLHVSPHMLKVRSFSAFADTTDAMHCRTALQITKTTWVRCPKGWHIRCCQHAV